MDILSNSDSFTVKSSLLSSSSEFEPEVEPEVLPLEPEVVPGLRFWIFGISAGLNSIQTPFFVYTFYVMSIFWICWQKIADKKFCWQNFLGAKILYNQYAQTYSASQNNFKGFQMMLSHWPESPSQWKQALVMSWHRILSILDQAKSYY